MKKLLLIASVLAWSAGVVCAQKAYNIVDYGAVGDGKTVNTKAIQKAIDDCTKAGGGQVLIPNGTFVSGSIWLKSNVELYLEPSAVLLGSPNREEDYEWVPYSAGTNSKRRSLIFADGQDNISIAGRGEVNGNGTHKNFQGGSAHGGLKNIRPYTFYIDNCTRVKMKDFTMKHGAYWNIKVEMCDDVLIDGVTVNSRVVANNDGIDVIDCSNVRIANCNVFTGDDGICLKSHRPNVTVRNVVITNCTVTSESSAIKLGVASQGGFENVTITNCALYDTRLSGINLKMVEGGRMDRITVSNITMHNVNGSIFMKLGWKKGYKPAVFRNVILSNIIADGIGAWKADKSKKYHKPEYEQQIGITITGQAECVMENITLSNIHLQFAGGGTQEHAARPLQDELPRGYPKYNNFGITPAYGINCQYVKDIRFNNIVFDYAGDDVRPAMFFQESENVTLNGIHARVSDEAKAYVRFRNQNGAFIVNSKPVSGKVPFASFEESARDITIMGNDFSNVKGAFIKDASVDEKQIKRLNNIE